MRIICFDVGKKRIGVAVSSGVIATGLTTFWRKGNDTDFIELAKLIKTEKATLLVVGLPTSLTGDENDMTAYVREFVTKLLQYVDIEVVFENEKLTSWEAEQMLIEAGMKREQRVKVIDKVAATLILESYLNNR